MNQHFVASVYAGGFNHKGGHSSNHGVFTYDGGDLTLEEWVDRLRLEVLTLKEFNLPVPPQSLLISIRASSLVNGVMVETAMS